MQPQQTVIDQGLPFVVPTAFCFDPHKGLGSSIDRMTYLPERWTTRQHFNSGKELKSSPDKSDELVNILCRYFEALNLTYRSRYPPGWNWHLSTLSSRINERMIKG